MPSKFKGTYQDLQDRVLYTGIVGQWKDMGNQKQFRADSDAVLNWWESSRTIQFQGPKDDAAEFQKAFDSVELGVESTSKPMFHKSKEAKQDTKIFIVHGHDEQSLEQLELVLRRLGLDPYILQNNAGQSRTLIEALEQQIYEQSAFGIILMTPDDFGYTKNHTDEDRQPRARQNVILEMGMVMASLGRSRMALLKKGNLEMPSDVNGLIYLEYNDHVKEVAAKLAGHMKDVGIKIDDAKITEAMH